MNYSQQEFVTIQKKVHGSACQAYLQQKFTVKM